MRFKYISIYKILKNNKEIFFILLQYLHTHTTTKLYNLIICKKISYNINKYIYIYRIFGFIILKKHNHRHTKKKNYC